MAYIGKLPATQGKDAGPALKLDDISSNFNGTKTVFDLTVDSTAVDPHVNNIAIYLSGVYQIPGNLGARSAPREMSLWWDSKGISKGSVGIGRRSARRKVPR